MPRADERCLPDGTNFFQLMMRHRRWELCVPGQERDVDGCDNRATYLAAFMSGEVSRLKAAGRHGTARNYARARCSFIAFTGGVDVHLSCVDGTLMEAYETWLHQRGVVRNTVSFYMRILRAVYNRAVRSGLAVQSFPFDGVYTGVDRTPKRAVAGDVVARLCHLDLHGDANLTLARDMFVFSFCMRGMAFVDMVFLRKGNLRGGIISYTRRKTGRPLSVKMEPAALRIVERYADAASVYLFPVVTAEDGRTAYAQYEAGLGRYNRCLKRISLTLGLSVSLSSYVARHSWATSARDCGIPVSVICSALGHASERTTLIYLDSLDDSVVDKANREVISVLDV